MFNRLQNTQQTQTRDTQLHRVDTEGYAGSIIEDMLDDYVALYTTGGKIPHTRARAMPYPILEGFDASRADYCGW